MFFLAHFLNIGRKRLIVLSGDLEIFTPPAVFGRSEAKGLTVPGTSTVPVVEAVGDWCGCEAWCATPAVLPLAPKLSAMLPAPAAKKSPST